MRFLQFVMFFAISGLSVQCQSPAEPVATVATTAFKPKSPAYYSQKLKQFLLKDQAASAFIGVDSLGVSTYASAKNKKLNKVECRLAYGEFEHFNRIVQHFPLKKALYIYKTKGKNKLPDSIGVSPTTNVHRHDTMLLSGLKIAIDPGHLGGSMDMAKIEWRYVMLKDSTQKSGEIAYNEGDIAMETALILSDMLKESGADVLLTRPKAGASSFGNTYADWLKANKLQKADPARTFHRMFKFKDMRNRARKINEFRPDLAVIIHYNAYEHSKRDAKGYFPPTEQNSNMIFIPGSFTRGELRKAESRMIFLYKLTSCQLEESLQASRFTIAQMEKQLDVPAEPKNSERFYLKRYSMQTGVQGVYSRNLSLCRLVHFPLVYGETLFQENLEEARMLSQKDFEYKGRKVSKRVYQVALAYFNGIADWAQADRTH